MESSCVKSPRENKSKTTLVTPRSYQNKYVIIQGLVITLNILQCTIAAWLREGHPAKVNDPVRRTLV